MTRYVARPRVHAGRHRGYAGRHLRPSDPPDLPVDGPSTALAPVAPSASAPASLFVPPALARPVEVHQFD